MNLSNVKKCVSLQPLTSTGLSYGVMVTRQILVLKFWVRAPIAQHNKRHTAKCGVCFMRPSAYLYRLNTRAVREVLYILMVWRTEPSSHFSGELKW